jgi:sirohydrochlorin cobaltochelatase
MNEGFADAALLLIGHGSTANEDSAVPARQHAAELRRRGLFQEVREAFWKQEPGIRTALAQIQARRVFIVPLFMSDGYFTQEVIPEELGLRQPGQVKFARTQKRGEQELHYCAPVGTHSSITSLILRRAHEVVEGFPFPRAPRPEETSLFLAGHGTDRNENSRRLIENQVALVQTASRYAQVKAVFMEEEPRISDWSKLATAKNVIVVPFLISDGLHANEDLPILLGESERHVRERLRLGQPTWRNPTERHGKRLWYTRSLGTEPHLADVILELVEEVARTPFTSLERPGGGAPK